MSDIYDEIYDDLENAAYNGMLLMDEVKPGWEKDINLEILDMYSGSKCIIGQSFPEEWFSEAVERLRIDPDDYGFSADRIMDSFRASGTYVYSMLTGIWSDIITDRLSQP